MHKWIFLFGTSILVTYCFTLAPSIVGGHSGELASVVTNSGVAHPPGYPLYTLLGKVFTLIPITEPALQLNLLSAVCSALTAVLLVWSIFLVTNNLWAGLVAVVLYALSPVVWEYSITADVLALNNLLVCLLLLLSIHWHKSQSSRTLTLSFFVCGLGLTNSQLFLCYVIPWVLYVCQQSRKSGWKLNIPGLIGFGLLGLSFYIYLPIASSFKSISSWGDQTSFLGFLTHVLNLEWAFAGEISYGEGRASHLGHQILFFVRETGCKFMYVLWPLSIYGLYKYWKLNDMGKFWIIAFLCCFVPVVLFSRLDLNLPINAILQSRNLMQMDLLLFFWLGIGLASLLKKLTWKPNLVCIGIFFVVGYIQLGLNFRNVNKADASPYTLLGGAVFETLPENALVVADGVHLVNTLKYFQQVKGIRSDVKLVDRQVLQKGWFRKWMGQHLPDLELPRPEINAIEKREFTLKQFIDVNLKTNSPVFLLGRFKQDEKSIADQFDLWPYGLLQQVLPDGESLSTEHMLTVAATSRKKLDIDHMFVYPAKSWEALIASHYWRSRQLLGSKLLRLSIKLRAFPLLLQSKNILLEVCRKSPEPLAIAFKDLGTAYQILGLSKPEHSDGLVWAWSNYVKLVKEGVELDQIKSVLATERRRAELRRSMREVGH